MKMRPIPWRVRLGLTLREMAIGLHTPWELPMVKLSEDKIAEGRVILERLKTKIPGKQLDYEELTLAEPKVFHEAGAISKDAWNKWLGKPKSIWPLKRDPKTGRMMKPCTE